MRILHTSDWHLGKHLEMRSRLAEQKEFMDQLAEITAESMADLIIVAGDIYDTHNPPAEAEKLFYESVAHLSDQGRRPVIILAGNHDSPERLAAPAPLAAGQGILIVGAQQTIIETGDYGGFRVTDSADGYIEFTIKDETAVIITIPYPSERRLNEILSEATDEQSVQKSYSDKIKMIFEKLSCRYRDDTVNIAAGHFYITGGETSESERGIQLGGSYAVVASALPAKAQYIAMGHLHRPQRVAGQRHGYYAGSPIQYSRSETGYAKCVMLADLSPGQEARVEKIYLRNYKPIEIWKADSIENAISLCQSRTGQNSWVYLEIETDRALTQSEIKAMKSWKSDIVEIRPILKEAEARQTEEAEAEKTMNEEFFDFYLENKGVAPTEATLRLFGYLSSEDDEPDGMTGKGVFG